MSDAKHEWKARGRETHLWIGGEPVAVGEEIHLGFRVRFVPPTAPGRADAICAMFRERYFKGEDPVDTARAQSRRGAHTMYIDTPLRIAEQSL